MSKQHNILFISGELEEGVRFQNLFSAHFRGIEFTHVADEREAFEYLEQLGQASLIIIDAAFRVDDLELFFSNISHANNNYPTIFYGTELFLKSRVPDNMYDLNLASGLLLKPLNINDFSSSVNRSLAWVKDKDVQEATINMGMDNFIPFRIRSFYRLSSVEYPIFMQITETKFIRIFEAKESFTHQQMHHYIKKGIRLLYFEKRDYLLFLSETMGKLRQILQSSSELNLELLIKSQIQASMIIQEYARAIGINDSIVEFIYLLIESIQEAFNREEELKKILVTFSFVEHDICERSVLTAYFCCAILFQLDWKGDQTQQKLGVASIFYDALVVHDEFISMESFDSMESDEGTTKEEIEEFQNHPMRVAELIRLSQGLPECDFILAQHHERPDSRGYPQGLGPHQITGVVAIFILASEFSQQLSNLGITKKTIRMVIDDFHLRYNSGSFREPLNLLTKMLYPGRRGR